MKKIIVVGGGAAGLMAAGTAAEAGNEVHIFEKNDQLGKKIYITGKGRCNLTNAAPMEEFMDNIPGNPYFLYSALYSFDNQATMEFFQKLGVETVVERGNRVFPCSQQAKDVVSALERFVRKNKVNIHLKTSVQRICVSDGKVTGILLSDGKEIHADKVILTTGGMAFPGTGSTGDGYRMAKELGHRVTKLYPSLVPLRCAEDFCGELMGLSLKNTAICIRNSKGKALYKDFGEMLFTHFGVSGPMILSASRHILGKTDQPLTLSIDLKPKLNEKELDQRVLRDFEKFHNKDFRNALDDLLPQKIIPVIIRRSGIDGLKKVHDITKEERKTLVRWMKDFTMTITGTEGFSQAVVTSGGIDTDQIDPGTMESKLVQGLYFAGEIIDVDAYTGGYNLQIAFSTGYAAGKYAGEERE